jgi:hypothetical protein
MKKPARGTSNDAWLEKFFLGTSAETKAPAFRPTQSPSERKAAETTRAFREVTEAAAEQRQAAAAKLKAARLARDDASALATQEPKAKKPGPSRKG